MKYAILIDLKTEPDYKKVRDICIYFNKKKQLLSLINKKDLKR